MKNTLLFTYSTNILVRILTVKMKNFLTPKMCDPILETLLKMRPNYSRSSSENATPSSGTSPLASYKEVPPSPGTEMAKGHHAHPRQSAFIHSFILSTSPLSLSPMGFLFLCAQIVSGCLILFLK